MHVTHAELVVSVLANNHKSQLYDSTSTASCIKNATKWEEMSVRFRFMLKKNGMIV